MTLYGDPQGQGSENLNIIPRKGLLDKNSVGNIESPQGLIVFALFESDGENGVREDSYDGTDLAGAFKHIQEIYPDADSYGYSVDQTGLPYEDIFGRKYSQEVYRNL